MQEYSRIPIERYCMEHNSAKMNIPLRRSRLYVIVPEMDPVHKPPSWKYPFLGQDS